MSYPLSSRFACPRRHPSHSTLHNTAALVAKQLNRRVRANTVVIGRLSLAGRLHKVGGVAAKLEAVAREGMRQAAQKAGRRRQKPVPMHVIITPEHMMERMPVDERGVPGALPMEMWLYLRFYPVADAERMLKILLHPADAKGTTRAVG